MGPPEIVVAESRFQAGSERFHSANLWGEAFASKRNSQAPGPEAGIGLVPGVAERP